jgi:hypothetical protein
MQSFASLFIAFHLYWYSVFIISIATARIKNGGTQLPMRATAFDHRLPILPSLSGQALP